MPVKITKIEGKQFKAESNGVEIVSGRLKEGGPHVGMSPGTLMTASLVLSIPRMASHTKRNLAFSYFIVGLPLYTTSMMIMKIMNLPVFPESLHRLLPTHFLDLFREPLKSWFTAQGFSYETYLRVYFSSVEPFIAEFPRLLLLILVIRVLRHTRTAATTSGP